MARSYFQYLDSLRGDGRMWKEQIIQEAIIQLGPEKLESLMTEADGDHDGAFEAVLLSSVVSKKTDTPLRARNKTRRI